MNGESKYIVIYTGVLTTLLIWFLSLSGAFNLPSGILYDTFVNHIPEQQNAAKKTLLVEIDYDQQKSGDVVWISFLQNLNAIGAGQVIFSFFPPNVSEKFYDKAVSMGNVIFGRQKLGKQDPAGEDLFDPIPARARGKKIITAPYDLPPNNYGVHRFEQAYFTVQNKKTPNFLVLAAQMRNTPELGEDNIFFINFMATTKKLPNIDFKRIVSGNLVPELVQDRSVIIGLKKAANSPGFNTPVHSGGNSISLVEYNGYALDTLIEQTSIKWPAPLTTLCFIITITFLGLTLYPLLSEIMILVYTGAFFMGCVIVTWVLLSHAFFWPPFFEIILTCATVLVFIFARKCSLKSRLAKEMILNRSIQIKKKFSATGFYESKEYWSRIINMVNQTLNLERAIFLDKVENDHRVKEIIALNTSISDIKERRRDYQRTPYSTAIKENKPIEIHSYFKTAKPNDVQYLVPLSFAGRLQGFWAFVISSGHAADISTLLPTINRFAVEIGEILYKRDKWHLEQAGQKSLINKILRFETKEDLSHEINNIINLLGRRVSILDLVFNSIESAVILYDIFGQVTHVNQGMSNFLKTMNIAPFKMTALDLAVKLTNHTAQQMRNLLSQTIISHDILTLPVTIAYHDKSFLLSIRPLLIEEENSLIQDDAYPFDLHGMLFEMIDVTDAKNSGTLKADLFERSNIHLKEGVESISNVCMMLEDDKMVAEQKTKLIENLNDKKDNLINFITELNDYMSLDVFSETYQVFPVSTLKIIKNSISQLQEIAGKKRISFEIASGSLSDLVLAGPGDLKKLFISLFSILLHDAYEETAIQIRSESKNGSIFYSIYNTGYGMPDEDFQRYLSSGQLNNSKFFQEIRQLSPKLKQWKCDLNGTSQVGKGIQFNLMLNKF
ncbi:CHASE2 domain-containing protein [Desulfobacula phenolica]|uniref:Sensor domain CHASE2-containing protein n=1 Tax=Desulfobacula phenolica TaxID=90732 RepID=A0A1H2JI46_9BACT|nr:CHASE2 domain-containing protein [Desulfobacula phenolica]SDU55836.1 sensor domain CHASE2-containing protein [Desulfobacula phenolica]